MNEETSENTVEIEKVYPTGEVVDKLRRLADALEQEKPLKFKLRTNEFMFRLTPLLSLNMNASATTRKWKSK